jgi:hypothetical protein
MTIVARYGKMAAATSVPLCGLADGAAVTAVLQAVTSATAATAIAVRLHILNRPPDRAREGRPTIRYGTSTVKATNSRSAM